MDHSQNVIYSFPEINIVSIQFSVHIFNILKKHNTKQNRGSIKP